MFPIRLSDDPLVAMNAWRWMLAAYVFCGCWIPVWLIIQPRDFTNVQVLYAGLLLLLAGSAVGGFSGTVMEWETMSTLEEGTAARGPMWPFLFITIACGAISGFHSLVASGTTVKQIPRESDCRRVGYNAMLLESFLALLVLTAVASQLGRAEYMDIVNPPGGGGNAVLAFSLACGRTFANLGIPLDVGSVLGILVIEGFLVTTLDTAVRLCRYLLEELWNCLFAGKPPAFLRWRAPQHHPCGRRHALLRVLQRLRPDLDHLRLRQPAHRRPGVDDRHHLAPAAPQVLLVHRHSRRVHGCHDDDGAVVEDVG